MNKYIKQLIFICSMTIILTNSSYAYVWQDLNYGWRALDNIVVTSSVTIYSSNTIAQVKQSDVIPLILGVIERCWATGISPYTPWGGPPFNLPGQFWSQPMTNQYSLWPHTNTMVRVPAYLDLNTFYSYGGSDYRGYLQNISTSIPAFYINYTNYWPSTTGVGVVHSYTSMVNQTVNYASSWTSTGRYVFVTSTNIGTSITVTNAYDLFTNSIGWINDRQLFQAIDTAIFAAIPYTVDTNIMVTWDAVSLFASNGIGSNGQFTSSPFMITTSTVYKVCYTQDVSQFWNQYVVFIGWKPSINGTNYYLFHVSNGWSQASNIVSYTSVVPQSVNWCYHSYKEASTSTSYGVISSPNSPIGPYVYTKIQDKQFYLYTNKTFNISNTVVSTNGGTFSGVPWQVNKIDLQERYKAIYAMNNFLVGLTGAVVTYRQASGTSYVDTVAQFATNATMYSITNWGGDESYTVYPLRYLCSSNEIYKSFAILQYFNIPAMSNFTGTAKLLVYPTIGRYTGVGPNPDIFNSYGVIPNNNSNWSVAASTPANTGWFKLGSTNSAPLDSPGTNKMKGFLIGLLYGYNSNIRPFLDYTLSGYIPGHQMYADWRVMVDWKFNYCTNKYW